MIARTTVRHRSAIYDELDDDPAELFHEASKIGGLTRLEGPARLAASDDLLASTTRAVRRHLHLPTVALGPSAPLSMSLGDALARRRSQREFSPEPLTLPEIAALLRAAYGVTGALGPQPVRAAPSGGALYPLELTLAVRRSPLEPGLYHYDPLDDVLELHRDGRVPIAAASPYAEIVGEAAAVLIVSAMFWRSRFKYGLRGYRFALIEAGHVAQNVLLAATSLGLAAVPLGGFYDRRVDELLQVNGVDESTLYLVCIGRPA